MSFGKRWDAFRVYMGFEFLTAAGLSAIWTLVPIYLIREVGLAPHELVLSGTALELSALIFEVPTGVIADVYSRRLSVILGVLLLAIGFGLISLTPIFALVLLSQAIAAVGYCCISGAAQAWLADEIGEEQAGRAFMRAPHFGQAGTLMGILIAIGAGSIDLRFGILVGAGVLLATAIWLALTMPETGFNPVSRDQRAEIGVLGGTFRTGLRTVRAHRTLLTLLLVAFVIGAFSEGYDRLWQYHLLNNFTLPLIGQVGEVVWMGTIGIISLGVAAIFTEAVRRRVDTRDPRRIARVLIRVNTLLIGALLLFAFAPTFPLAMIAHWLIGPLRGLNDPLRAAWLNQGLDPQVRATVLSINAQADAFGQIVGGPGIGVIGSIVNVRAALALGAVILSPSLILYARTLKSASALPAAVSEVNAG
jgi:DHA3 family tetracycline resistance protein-like MFS transporter